MSTTSTAPTITADQPLNTIVANYPQALPILQRFGLDTCCGGAIPLGTAAEHHGLSLADVLAALQAATGAEQR